jgi:hypothetical protein
MYTKLMFGLGAATAAFAGPITMLPRNPLIKRCNAYNLGGTDFVSTHHMMKRPTALQDFLLQPGQSPAPALSPLLQVPPLTVIS